ncbi:MAG: hypothetical protein J6T04_05555 [Bacteroidales bacterium]|nr:hypothetical protein [Bacteroidales bacterium]
MKILIVYAGHDDSTSANGVCVWNIAKELKNRGHEVWAIWQFKEAVNNEFEKNGVHCFGIKESWYYTFTQWHISHRGLLYDLMYKFISLLRLIYILPLFPNISPLVTLKCRRMANKIIKLNGIDNVLGIYMPYHAINTTLYLKNKYKDKLKVVNYHLDLISSPNNINSIVKNYKIWKGNRAVRRELSLIDLMLLPISAKGAFKSEKIRFVDFPLFVQNSEIIKSDFVFPTDSINIIYIGSLDKCNRNPSYTLSLLEKCSHLIPKSIRVHIWGNLADQETKAIIEKFDFVAYHGLLDNIYVQDILRRSDYLLNISNFVTYNMIPSKIFQMFSMHKPIINIVRHEGDASLGYFSKYPNVMIIREYSNFDFGVQSLCDFLTKGNLMQIKYNDILYIESTPSYICDYIDGKK